MGSRVPAAAGGGKGFVAAPAGDSSSEERGVWPRLQPRKIRAGRSERVCRGSARIDLESFAVAPAEAAEGQVRAVRAGRMFRATRPGVVENINAGPFPETPPTACRAGSRCYDGAMVLRRNLFRLPLAWALLGVVASAVLPAAEEASVPARPSRVVVIPDRKSTRLNSSH